MATETREVYVTYKGLSGVDIPDGAVVFNSNSSLGTARDEAYKSLSEDGTTTGAVKDAVIYSVTETGSWYAESKDFGATADSSSTRYFFLGSDDPASDLTFNITDTDAFTSQSSNIIWVGFGKANRCSKYDSAGTRIQNDTVGVPTAGKVVLNIGENVDTSVYRIAVAGVGETQCDHDKQQYESGGGTVNISGKITVTNDFRLYQGGVLSVNGGGSLTVNKSQTNLLGVLRVQDEGSFSITTTSTRNYGSIEIIDGTASFSGGANIADFTVKAGTVTFAKDLLYRTAESRFVIEGGTISVAGKTNMLDLTMSGGTFTTVSTLNVVDKIAMTGGEITVTAGNAYFYGMDNAISNAKITVLTAEGVDSGKLFFGKSDSKVPSLMDAVFAIDNSTIEANSVTVNAKTTVTGGTLTASTMTANNDLTLTSGTINVVGTESVVFKGTTTIAGGEINAAGGINFNGATAITGGVVNVVNPDAEKYLTVNVYDTLTISGTGVLKAELVQLQNGADIVLKLSGSEDRVLLDISNATNMGVLRSTATGSEVVLDVTDFTGDVCKAADLTQKGGAKYNSFFNSTTNPGTIRVVNGEGQDYKYVVSAQGDIFVYGGNVAYLNTGWGASTNVGNVVGSSGSSVYFGVNAFCTYEETVSALGTDGGVIYLENATKNEDSEFVVTENITLRTEVKTNGTRIPKGTITIQGGNVEFYDKASLSAPAKINLSAGNFVTTGYFTSYGEISISGGVAKFNGGCGNSGTLNITGGEVSVTGNLGVAVNSTVNISGGTLTCGGLPINGGTVNVILGSDDATMLKVNGAISSNDTANAELNINVTNFTGDVCKAVDVNSVATSFTADNVNVIGKDGYQKVVLNGDIFVWNGEKAYVDANATGDDAANGKYFGVNLFNNIDNALAAVGDAGTVYVESDLILEYTENIEIPAGVKLVAAAGVNIAAGDIYGGGTIELNGGTLTILSDDTYTTVLSGVTVNLKNNASIYFDFDGMYVGGVITSDGTGTVTVNDYADYEEESFQQLTIKGQGSTTLSGLNFDANVTAEITEGTLTLENVTATTITASAIVVKGDVTAETITGNVTIATGFTGDVDKVINGTVTGTVTAPEGYVYQNGFIIKDDLAEGIVYVNSSYTGEFGAETADGKYIGINAFATLEAANASTGASIVVTGEVAGAEVTKPVTLSAGSKVTGTLTAGNVTVSGNAEVEKLSAAIVAVNEGATLTAGEITVNSFSGNITATKMIFTGNITVPAGSTIFANIGTLVNNGTITVDISNIDLSSGSVKVLDLNGFDGTDVVFSAEIPSGCIVIKGNDGDISFVSADTSVLFVNPEYTEDATLDAGLFYGVNAFDTFAGAHNSQYDGTINITGNVTDDTIFQINKAIVIEENATLTLKLQGGSLTSNSTVVDANVVVNGTLAFARKARIGQGYTFTVNETGKINASGQLVINGTLVLNLNEDVDAPMVTAQTLMSGLKGSEYANITIKLNGFDGDLAKIIDVEKVDATYDFFKKNGMVTIDGANAADYSYIVNSEGDITLVKTALLGTSTLEVGNAYNVDDHTLVNGKVVGVNAFASLSDASATAVKGGVTINLEGEYASAGDNTSVRADFSNLAGELTISGKMAANESIFAELNDDKDDTAAAVKLTLNNGEFAASKLKADNNATINITNATIHGVYTDEAGTGTALLYAKNSGKVFVNGADLQSVRLSLAAGGDIEIADSSLSYGAGASITVDGEGSTLTITGSTVDVDTFNVTNGGVMSLTGTTLTENNGGEGNFSVGAGSTLNLTNSTVNSVATFTNAGTINVTGGTFKAANLNTLGAPMLLEGTVTIQIDELTGGIRAKDGIVINNSWLESSGNGTLSLLGDATVNGGLSVAYLQGRGNYESSFPGEGGVLTIANGTTVAVSYGVEFSNNYTINGGKIVVSGGNANGDVWGCVFQDAEFTINSDIEVVGGGNTAPIHFSDAVATINGNITHQSSGGEPIYIGNSTVTISAGATVSGETGLRVYLGSNVNVAGTVNASVTTLEGTTFNVNGGTITGASLTNAGTFTSFGGTVTVGNLTNDGTMTFGPAAAKAFALRSLNGSGLEVTGTLTNNGEMTINSGAELVAANIVNNEGATLILGADVIADITSITNNGTLQIDASTATGAVANLIGDCQITGSGTVEYINFPDGYSVMEGLNGEMVLIREDINTNVLYVDAAAAGKNFGTELVDGSDKYVGINTYDTFTKAWAAVENGKTINVTGTVDGTGIPSLAAGKEVTVSGSGTVKLNAAVQILGTLNIGDGSDVRFESFDPSWDNGNIWSHGLNVRNGATLNVSGTGTKLYVAYLLNRGVINVSNGAEVTTLYPVLQGNRANDIKKEYVDSKLVIDNASFIVDPENSSLAGEFGEPQSGENTGSLTVEVKNGGLLKLYNSFTLYANSSVTVDASSDLVFAEAGMTFTNNGTLTIAYGADVDFTNVVNNGTITLDVAGLTSGVAKVLDFDSFSGNAVELKNVASGMTVKTLADGDIFISTVKTDVLYVDKDWTGAYGEEVAAGKFFGINAFANVKNAFAMAQSAFTTENVTISVDDHNLDESSVNVNLTEAGTYTLTGTSTGKMVRLFLGGADTNVVLNGLTAAFGKILGGRNDFYDDGTTIPGDQRPYVANTSFTVKDSFIGSYAADGAGGGWATFFSAAVTIENSVFGARWDKFNAETIKTIKVGAAATNGNWQGAYGQNYSGMNLGVANTLNVTKSTLYTGFFAVGDKAVATLNDAMVYLGGSLNVGQGKDADGQYHWNNINGGSADVATLTVGNGSVIYNVGYGNGHGSAPLHDGGYGVQVSGKLVLTGGAKMLLNTTEMQLRSENVRVLDGGSMVIEQNALLDAGTVTVNGSLNVNSATLKAELLKGTSGSDKLSGTVYVNGNSTVEVGSIDDKNLRLRIGQTYDAVTDSNSKPVGNSNLNTVSFTAPVINVKFAQIFDTKITFNGDTVMTINSGYMMASAADINLEAGKTLTVNGKVVFDNNVTLNAGTYVFNGQFSNQGADDTTTLIGEGATLTHTGGSGFSAYEDMTIEGTVNVTGSSVQVGYHQYGFSNGAVMTIDGGTLNVNAGKVVIYAAKNDEVADEPGEEWCAGETTGQILESKLVITSGGKLNVMVGNIENNGTITVDAQSDIIANTITGNGKIEIDVTGFTEAVEKIIDTKVKFDKSNIEIIGTGAENYHVHQRADGDIYISTADISNIYVNSDWSNYNYGDVIVGREDLIFGINAFAAWDTNNDSIGTGAFDMIHNNGDFDLAATIYIEKTADLSGFCVSDTAWGAASSIRNYKNLKFIVEDGGKLGYANGSAKITQEITVNAGGAVVSMKANSGGGQVQLESTMTLNGEEGKTANLWMVYGNQFDQSFAVKYEDQIAAGEETDKDYNYAGKLIANYADIKVADFAMMGEASFTNSTILVKGTVAFGKDYKTKPGKSQTMTNSTMTVTGNNVIKSESYYAADNELKNLTMDNSNIIFNDGKDGSYTAEVKLDDNLILNNGSIINTVDAKAATVIGDVVVNSNSGIVASVLGVAADASISFNNANVTANSIDNKGKFNVTGTSTLAIDNFASNGDIAFIGKDGDAAGTHKVTLGSNTADKVTFTGSNYLYFYGAELTFSSDVSSAFNGGQFFYFKNSTVDLGGNTLSIDGGKFLTRNLSIDNGKFIINDTTGDAPCWQGDNVIGAGVEVISERAQNIYGNLTLKGTLDTYQGTPGNGVDRVGVVANGFDYSHSAVLTLESGARYTIHGGPGFEVATATNKLIVEEGATFDMKVGTFTNKGTVTVDGATLFNVAKMDNAADLTIKGTTTVNGLITGTGVVTLDSAKLSGVITGDANAVITGAATAIQGTSTDVTFKTLTVSKNSWVKLGAELTVKENIEIANGAFLYVHGISGKDDAGNNIYTYTDTKLAAGSVTGNKLIVDAASAEITGDVNVNYMELNYNLVKAPKATVTVGGNLTAAVSTSNNAEGTTASLTVGGTWTVSGNSYIKSGSTINVGNIVNNASELEIGGWGDFAAPTVNVTGSITGKGRLEIRNKAVVNAASVNTTGDIYIGYTYNDLESTAQSGATLNVTGDMSIASGKKLDIALDSKLNVAGTLTNNGSIKVNENVTIDAGSISNAGTITVDGATLTADTVKNNSTIDVNGASFIVTELETVKPINVNNSIIEVGKVTYTGTPVDYSIVVSGTSTVKIDDLNNGYVMFHDADAKTVTLKDSYVNNGVAYVSGSLVVDGTFDVDGDLYFGDAHDPSYGGTITGGVINAGSMVIQRSTMEVNNTINANYVYLSYGADVTVNGKLTANSSSWIRGTTTVSGTGTYSGGNVMIGDDNTSGKLVINGTFTAGNVVLNDSDDVLEINNGKDTTVTSISNAGTIKIDETSRLIADSIVGNGKIQIDLDGIGTDVMVKQIIDVKSKGDLDLNDIVIENGEGYKAYQAADGDIWVSNTSTETAFIDGDWKGAEFGDKVAEGKYYGINAFDDLAGAIALGYADIVVEDNGTLSKTTDLQHNAKLTGNGEIAIGKAGHQNELQIGRGADAALTITGADTDIDFTIGTINISGKDTAVDHVRGAGVLNITEGADVSATGMLVRGELNVTGSTLTVNDGGNSFFRVAAGNEDGLATVAKATFTDAIFNVKGNDSNAFEIGFQQNETGVNFKGELELVNSTMNIAAGTMNVSTDGVVTVNASDINAASAKIVNNGTITVTGESDIAANISGTGMLYLNSATLSSATQITGAAALVRAASGNTVIDGANLNVDLFNVGAGGKINGSSTFTKDENVDRVNGVTVTLKNTTLKAGGSAYDGWIGTEYNLNNAITDARYTLNAENSDVYFGYLHVSTDGILNVTDSMFHAGTFIVNGEANLSNVKDNAVNTAAKISVGIDTANEAVLNITNGSVIDAHWESGKLQESLLIENKGVVNVDASELYARQATIASATAKLNLTSGAEFTGTKVTNAGTITVDDASMILGSYGSITSTLDNSGDIYLYNGATAAANALTNTGFVYANDATVNANSVANNGTIQLDGGSLISGKITGNGYLYLNENFTVDCTDITQNRIYVGYVYEGVDANGKDIWSNPASDWTIAEDTVLNVNKVQFGKNSDLTVNAGKTMTINGAAALWGTENLVSGTLTITGTAQLAGGTVAEGAVLNANDYLWTYYDGKLDVNGTLNANGENLLIAVAVDEENGTVFGDNTFTLNVSGANAVLSVEKNAAIQKNSYGSGTLKVSDGATANINGTLTNDGEVVVSSGNLTVSKYVDGRNDFCITVSGTSSINIDDFQGKWMLVNAGTTLKDSTIGGKGYNNEGYSVYALGSLNVDGSLTVSGTLWFGDRSNVITGGEITGGTITAGSLLIQHSEMDVKNDVTANYVYLSYKSDVTISGSIAANETTWIRGTTTVNGALNGADVVIGDDNTSAKLVVNGTFNADQVVLTDSDDTIAIGAGVTITADSITNNGTITIDATSYVNGFFKAIDVDTAAGLDLAKIQILNNTNGAFLYQAEDGDVYLTLEDQSTLYVNDDYTADNSGTHLYGYNAFSKGGDMIAALTGNTKVSKVVLEDALTTVTAAEFDAVTTDENLVIANKVSLSLGEGMTEAKFFVDDTDGWAIISNGDSVADVLTIDKGVTLASNGAIYCGYDTAMNIVVDGTIDANVLWVGNVSYVGVTEVVVNETGKIVTPEGVILRSGCAITVNGSGNGDVQIDNSSYYGLYSGTMTLNNTVVEGGMVYLGNGKSSGESTFDSALVLNDSVMNITTSFEYSGDNLGTVTLNGNSELTVGTKLTGNENVSINLNGTSKLNILGKGSVFTGTLTATDYGALYVGDWDGNNASGADLTIGAGASVDMAGYIYVGTAAETSALSTLTVTGELAKFNFAESQGIYVREDGKLVFDNASVANDGKIVISTFDVGGELVLNNTEVTSHVFSSGSSTESSIVMTDSKITIAESVLESNGIVLGYKLDRNANLSMVNSTIDSVADITFGKNDNGGYGKVNVTMTSSTIQTTGALNLGVGSSITMNGALNADNLIFNGENTSSVIDGTIAGKSYLKFHGSNNTMTINGTAEFANIDNLGGNTIIVNGTLDNQNGLNYHFYNRGKLEVNGNGDGSKQFTADYMFLYGANSTDTGVFSLNDTVAEATYLVIGHTSKAAQSNGQLLMDGSTLTVSKLFFGNAYTEDSKHMIELTNGSVLKINHSEDISTPGSATEGLSSVAEMIVSGASTVSVTGDFNTAGSIKLDGTSKFTVTGEMTVSGSITLSTNSTMELATATISSVADITLDASSTITIGTLNINDADRLKATNDGTVNVTNMLVDITNFNASESIVLGTGINSLANIDLFDGGSKVIDIADLNGEGSYDFDYERNDGKTISGQLVFEDEEVRLDFSAATGGYFKQAEKYRKGHVITEMDDAYYYGGENFDEESWGEPIKNLTTTLDLDAAITGSDTRIYGGSLIDGVENDSNGKTVLTIESASGLNRVFGGNRITNDGFFNGTFNINVTINSEDSDKYKMVFGGHHLESGMFNMSGVTNVTINGGTFSSRVVAGSLINSGKGQASGFSYLTINGGTFNGEVFAGSFIQQDGDFTFIGDLELTITGGTFNKSIYGGNGEHNAATGTSTVFGNTNITISGGSFDAKSSIYGGSFDLGIVRGNSTITLTSNAKTGTVATIKGTLDGDSSNAQFYLKEMVEGERTLAFKNYGTHTLYAQTIRNFDTIELMGNSNVTVQSSVKLSEVSLWEIEEGSSLTGFSSNNLSGDTIALYLDDVKGLTGGSWEIMTGDGIVFDDSLNIINGDNPGQRLKWDGDSYTNSWSGVTYDLAYNEEKKSLVLTSSVIA